MAKVKVTKVEKLEAIKGLVQEYPDYVEFLDAEIARLNARAGKVAEKRAEKNVEKRDEYEGAILGALEHAGRAITLAELVAGVNIEDVTPGRVAYYAGQLVKAGQVTREKAKVDGKKVTIYAIAQLIKVAGAVSRGAPPLEIDKNF